MKPHFRQLAFGAALAALLAPAVARADVEPLLNETKLVYKKQGDLYFITIMLDAGKARQVILQERSVGKIAIVNVLAIVSKLPKATPQLAQALIAAQEKLVLGRVQFYAEGEQTFALYKSSLLLEGTTAKQLLLQVEIAAVLAGVVEQELGPVLRGE